MSWAGPSVSHIFSVSEGRHTRIVYVVPEIRIEPVEKCQTGTAGFSVEADVGEGSLVQSLRSAPNVSSNGVTISTA